MRIGRLLVAAGFLVLPTSIAFAEYSYIGLQAGGVFLGDSDISQGGLSLESSYDTGYLLGVTVGRSFQNFRLEGELSYRSNDADEVEVLGVSAPAGGSLSSTSLMLNGYFDIGSSSPVRPYVGAGLGAAQVSFDEFDIDGTVVADDDDLVFAYQLAAGVSFDVGPTFMLDLGYKYFATADPSFEDIGGFPFDAEYSSHNVVIGAKFKF